MSARARRLLVAGGGFAGVWACAAASALRHRLGARDDVEIHLISRDEQLTLRPRLYEEAPDVISIPLSPILSELDVRLDVDEISAMDLTRRCLFTIGGAACEFDALVLAMGSRLARPAIPGLAQFALDVDTLAAARTFWDAVRACPDGATVAVIGAGLTGLELATELAAKKRFDTLLIDSRADFSHLFAPDAAGVIESALTGIRTRLGQRVVSIDRAGVRLATGEQLTADVVAWTAGMRAHPLAESLGHTTDSLGRLVTNPCLGLGDAIYAAGDIAHVVPEPDRAAPMSCQFAIPTGITAGYNAMAELLQQPAREFQHPRYVTCMDLGDAGGLLTQGWERTTVSSGQAAKETKKRIMHMICPPADRDTLYNMAEAR